MSDINSKTTRERFLDDLETMAAWREDLDARKRRAEICQHSSVGLSDERLEALVHEGRAWNRAANHLIKRWRNK